MNRLAPAALLVLGVSLSGCAVTDVEGGTTLELLAGQVSIRAGTRSTQPRGIGRMWMRVTDVWGTSETVTPLLNGTFEVRLPTSARVAVTGVFVDGRWGHAPDGLLSGPGGQWLLEVVIPEPLRLEIVSSVDGRALSRVSVELTGTTGGSTSPLVAGASSPVRMPEAHVGAAPLREYTVRANGHAAARVRLDHRLGGSVRLALQPEGP